MGFPSDLKELIKKDYVERCEVLNLNASENHMSKVAHLLLGLSPSYDCYEFPPCAGNITGPWQFSDNPVNETIHQFIASRCLELLGSDRVDARLRGGQAAEIAVLLGLSEAGDNVFYVSEEDGGHFGLTEIAKRCGINLCAITFDHDTHWVDIDKTMETLKKYWTPNANKLVVLNQSFILRSQRWLALVNALKAEYPDVIISCDVSHLLGLIVGKQIINPLDAGVDLIHASTHKTFPGPQKAIVVFNPNFDRAKEEAIRHTISPVLQSYCGTGETLVLAYVLHEMQCCGASYAAAVCRHAKLFAKKLDSLGLTVVGREFDFTETHQCWIAIGTEHEAWRVSGWLHAAGIRNLPAYLPFVKTWGLRLGVSALTRRGFSDNDFIQLAEWIKEVILAKNSPKLTREKVLALSNKHPISDLSYTLDKDHVSMLLNIFFSADTTI